jgi:hypothetical protein
MLALLRQNYGTYTDERSGASESQVVRLLIALIVSILLSIFVPNSSSQVFSMMATGITVLTGFTFTALFSDHALAGAALPKPKTENDRHDLRILRKLAVNFRARSSYFIGLSILEIFLLAIISFDFTFSEILERIEEPWHGIWVGSVLEYVSLSLPYIATSIVAFVIFIYLECLYTFYRLAETILAILDTRRSYLNLDDDSVV